jgi:hypothetical protein
MKLVGFNFKKIHIEKTSDTIKSVKLNTKIDIANISSVESKFLKEEEDLIKIDFTYLINYDPEIAKIELGGSVLLAIEKTLSRGILEGWKEKKMSEDFRVMLFNLILRKANVKALELEEQMNLPLHIPMPSLKKQDKKTN